MKVAYQGMPGAYSELAALKHFGRGAEVSGLALSEEVVDAVLAKRADFGVLPVENTIAGPVAVNAELFLKSPVFVVGECYLRIDHCLLATPGATLKMIRNVYSHPVALAQCLAFLKRHHLKAVPEYDTAGAAELVSRRGAGAAIASEACAKAYGLHVLRRNIQTFKENITRFLVFTRKAKVPRGLKMQKTSLAFSTKHEPGALLSCLRSFADRGINLTRLESHPIPQNPFEYVFYADIVGGLEDAPVKAALAEVRRSSHVFKIIGSYPLGRR